MKNMRKKIELYINNHKIVVPQNVYLWLPEHHLVQFTEYE